VPPLTLFEHDRLFDPDKRLAISTAPISENEPHFKFGR
jgi:hypothetical protein